MAMQTPFSFDELLRFIDAENARLHARYGKRLSGAPGTLAYMVKLMEELGELSQQVLASQAMQRQEKLQTHAQSGLAEEVADVLITALILARDLDVDIADALGAKMRKIESRYQ